MADEGKSSLANAAMYVAGALILLGVIAAIVWFITGGWELFDAHPGLARRLVAFSAAIAIVAIALALIVKFIFGGGGDGGLDIKGLIDKVFAIPPMQAAGTVIGFATIGLIAWFILTKADVLSTPDKARGLITFAVAIVTVSIALIMVFYVIFGPVGGDAPPANPPPPPQNTAFSSRFTFGKDVLMVFVGILGTIMGFYYGNSNKVAPDDVKTIQQSGSQDNGAAAATKVLETKAFDFLVKQNYDDAVKAFDLVSKATPPSTNIANINEIMKSLAEKKDDFTSTVDKKDAAWRKLYCDISNNNWAVGQSKEISDKFGSGCKTSPAANTTTPPTPGNANANKSGN
jgi:hypothetical protein